VGRNQSAPLKAAAHQRRDEHGQRALGLRGVRYSARHAVTHSLVLRGKTGTLRYVESYHNMDRLSKISAVQY